MALDLDRIKFVGALHRVAEKELAAPVGDDQGEVTTNRLYDEFVAAGKPKDLKKWARDKLPTVFLCADQRPAWVGGTPQWAFMDGRPMVFLRQFEMGTTPAETRLGLPPKTLYVFALRVDSEYGGWEMRYRVVQDDLSTKGFVSVPTDVGVVAGPDAT